MFDIKKFAIHDGPGIRTTVFLKGCPLRCRWCHNPESMRASPEISFLPDRCIGCGYCFKACPRQGHAMIDGQHILHRERCLACGSCTKECYAEALELSGREMTVSEVMAEVIKDKPFYDNSGGGLTISGGEPLQQFAFTRELLRAARESGLHNCLDTSGFAPPAKLLALVPMVDLFLYDIKETDAARHRELTGVSNRRILANLRRLDEAGATFRLRLPLVPGVNDRPEHLSACGELARSLVHLGGVDVLPFHRLGTSKNRRMGYAPATDLEQIATPSDELVESWLAQLHRAGAPQARRS